MNPHWDTLTGDDAITTLEITEEVKYANSIGPVYDIYSF